MKPMKWTNIDKSAWPRGPWDDEPDKEQWTDKATGLPCLIVRNSDAGNLCGYVGLPPGHPFHGKGYSELATDPEVHGGLTFAAACRPSGEPGRGICHVTEPGEPDAWWLGFDCAHFMDVSPNTRHVFTRIGDEAYRDVAYVKSECAKLAAQLAAVR